MNMQLFQKKDQLILYKVHMEKYLGYKKHLIYKLNYHYLWVHIKQKNYNIKIIYGLLNHLIWLDLLIWQ